MSACISQAPFVSLDRGPCLWVGGWKAFYAGGQLKHYCYIITEKAVKAVVSIEIPYTEGNS